MPIATKAIAALNKRKGLDNLQMKVEDTPAIADSAKTSTESPQATMSKTRQHHSCLTLSNMGILLVVMLLVVPGNCLDCSTPPNNGTNPSDPTQCLCVNQTYWFDFFDETCYVNCFAVQNADYTEFDQSTTTCSCAAGYTWVPGYFLCLPNCTSINFTTGVLYNSNSSCQCQPGFHWDYANASCMLPCSTINYTAPGSADSANGSCVCTINYWFDVTVLYCKVNCSAIAFATGVTPSNQTCFCMAGYTWNVTFANCSLYDATLTCNSPLVWNANLSACVPNCTYPNSLNSTSRQCQLNCSMVAFSVANSLNNTNTSCECDKHHYWDVSSMACSYNATYCDYPYRWNYTANGCWLDCSNFQFSTPNAGSADNSTCNCTAPYAWNSSNHNCTNTQTAESCSSPSFWNDTIQQCQQDCSAPYSWSAAHIDCYLECHSLNNSYWSIDNHTCLCHDEFVWDHANLICRENCSWWELWNNTDGDCWVNCSILRNSTGTPIDNETCECAAGYTWDGFFWYCRSEDNTTQNCTGGLWWDGFFRQCRRNCSAPLDWDPAGLFCYLNCSLINFTQGYSYGFSEDNSTCQCNNNSRWDWVLGLCVPNNQSCSGPLFFYPTVSGCWLNCSNFSNSNQPWISPDNLTCVCNRGYVWSIWGCQLANGSNTQCPPGFDWDTPTGSCKLDCCKVPNGMSNINDTFCKCRKNYHWNPATGNCDILCCNIDNVFIDGYFNASYCECKKGYEWNWNTTSCDRICQAPLFYRPPNSPRCVLNCSAANASFHPSNPSRCVCQPGYFWNPILIQCYNCSQVPDVDPTVPSTGDKCACEEPYAWSRSTFTCALDCGKVRGSTGFSNNGGCQCERGYQWDEEVTVCRRVRYITRDSEASRKKRRHSDDSDSDD